MWVNNLSFDKNYSHKDEGKIYQFWLDNDVFLSDDKSEKESYCVVMPPPNITGSLHLGHALNQTIQDILIRFKRMCGFEVLFLPGTDHASIATEVKILENMRNEGLYKKDLGREDFLKKAWDWKEKYGGKIIEQIKKLGTSCDWRRERFTKDEICSNAVSEFFVRLYKKGLIYRGARIVNWCPNCLTSISDAEVEYKEFDDFLFTINYYICDDKLSKTSVFLSVATTRPETIFADVALAVNPKDERYSRMIGKSVFIPIENRIIPVVSDESIDIDYGTGVLKVTPGHSFEDFEIGIRHNFNVLTVINEDGTMNDNCKNYGGFDRFKVRELICEELNNSGFLQKKEKIVHNVGCCYRCGTVIEPMVSTQWFVKMNGLAKNAIDIVKNGDIVFAPKHFEKVHFHWMENIKDWCISRQLWWGHRIPAWYCGECNHITVSKNNPKKCENCNSKNIKQDEDILDTWFSSALWPFSVFGWPDSDYDKKFFPTNTLVTGRDIIFFWVSRMIFSSLELTNKIPFKHVLIHGLVRDGQGRKMSKSLGNGIDPIEVIDNYGADALRISLISGLTLGNDTRFSNEKLEGSKNFLNKVWNASRYVHMNVKNLNIKFEDLEIKSLKLTHNLWILSKFSSLIDEIYKNFDEFELGLIFQKIYDFFWDDFCDWYLEIVKFDFKSGEEKVLETSKVVFYLLINILKVLHPFAPFITEKIFKIFNSDPCVSISVSKFPKPIKFKDTKSESKISEIINIIKKIRVWNNENLNDKNTRPDAYILCDENRKVLLKQYENIIIAFTKLKNLFFINNFDSGKFENKNFNLIFTDNFEIYVSLPRDKEKTEILSFLAKEIEGANSRLDKYKKLIDDKNFQSKAPEKVRRDISEKFYALNVKIEKLKEEKNKYTDEG
ncbi:MAG: valine--tRNA ligase [Candidatus Improbicoccus pseudotrichonymphae]|uniref:Valine--tRNA ligase n=1 Tax=Candidatus Improbicoccus pseudotrichonymphae TaxID=3033792 RepID=A0AA48I4R0_9FIRM|nr:MAG: valine--tRNA ligase [Candidatus Improbicoccus pseudotrichonymphae]